MLEYDRNDVSEDIYTNETYGSCGCIICHEWYLSR